MEGMEVVVVVEGTHTIQLTHTCSFTPEQKEAKKERKKVEDGRWVGGQNANKLNE